MHNSVPHWFANLAAALALMAPSAPAQATDFFWNYSLGGPFTNAVGWSPFNPLPPNPVSGPGGASDTVNFALGVTAESRYTMTDVIGTNNRLLVHDDSLTLQIGNYALLDASPEEPSFTVGVSADDNGDVILSGNTGSVLSTQHSSIGHAAGSTGTVTVDNLPWVGDDNLVVGHDGTGKLTIQNSAAVSNAEGIIGRFSDADGDVTVTGDGSTWTNNAGLTIGSFGQATLRIEAGGRVSTNTAGRIGLNAGSAGDVIVTGDGSTWTTGSHLSIGNAGTGTLTIEDGGEALATSVTVSDSSTVNVRGPNSHWSTHVLGLDPGSSTTFQDGAVVASSRLLGSSAMVVDGADTTWTISGASPLTSAVGFVGSGGMLTVSGGAGVTFNHQLFIGVTSNATGTVLVSGEDSTLSSTGLFIGGGLGGGAGTLTIENGGSVSSSAGRFAISNGSTGTVTVTGAGSSWDISGNLTAGELGPGTLNIMGGEVVVGGTLSANNQSNIRLDGGKLTVNGLGAGAVAALDWQSGTLRLTGADGLTIGAAGSFGPMLLLTASQTLEVDQTLTVENTATLFVASGLQVGSGVVASGGQLFIGGATQQFGAGLTNHGDVVFNAESSVTGPVTGAAGGAITLLADVTFNDEVSGPGNFFGQGTATFVGGFSPGASPAKVSFESSVVLASSNTLLIELGGLLPDDQHDHLSIAGDLTLDGTLEVELTGGFAPTAGNTFDLFDAATLTGQFTQLNLPALGEGRSWDTTSLYTTGVLSVVPAPLAGDYNGNGVVDAADYTVWRDTLGQVGVGLPADGDGSQTVDATDYTVWMNNFGNAGTVIIGSNQAAVPEPGSLALMIGLLTALATLPRRVRSLA